MHNDKILHVLWCICCLLEQVLHFSVWAQLGKNFCYETEDKDRRSEHVLWGVSLFSGNCHKWSCVKVLCRWRLVALGGMLSWEIDKGRTTTASWEDPGSWRVQSLQIHLCSDVTMQSLSEILLCIQSLYLHIKYLIVLYIYAVLQLFSLYYQPCLPYGYRAMECG